MLFNSIVALPALAVLAAAAPWKSTTTTATWGTTPTPTPTSTWGTTPAPTTTPTSTWGTTPSPTPTGNNGSGFVNQCENLGISILDCTELGNIAALNGNSVGVGGSGGSGSAVNNGQQFLNDCKNFGISVADCAELLNIALLNGNTIDIDLPDLTSLISALGLSATLLSGLPLSGLVAIPTGLL